MSQKGHIVKNSSALTEKDKYKKGKIDRKSLGYIKLDKHPLRVANSKSIKLATHHILSIKATESLAKVRRNLLKMKAYDVNHLKNLVTLPTEKQVCCHYALPRHVSGHTGKQIAVDYSFDEKTAEDNLTALHSAETDETSLSEATLKDDMHRMDELFAYHKICRMKLSIQIKMEKLNCSSKPEKVVNSIDKLSTNLLIDISQFKLNLFNSGKFYQHDNKVGCKQKEGRNCSSERVHNYNQFSMSSMYLIPNKLLKNVYRLKDEFKIECNAPAKYKE
ncbi:Putative uncharacterized protein [Moritella viscosa]|uniref:AHH domain-containing protein n=1 Tax=Moritella viscosa TaxID=80854 RepID=UPI000508FBDF|nr:AHH domain-containing protein [Moritella viscosa]CED60735.1 putative uncharacterized protein [Moritella viscosa]SGZ03049.1 Putative uncharacterized protein [Moritella viscosa]SHO11990.1 Putative uncharacterized protein [Moritella viscosa]SHO22991.1 Putative uncharacterized protein [Moritella viscosa]